MKNLEFLKNIVIAHRGIHDNIKIYENTMEAFKQSIKRKIPIELDVHILQDNEIAVYHDNNLKRLTGIDRDIKTLTSKELSNIKIKNKYSIPLLKDVLKLVNGKVLLDIEIKDDLKTIEICEQLAILLDEYKGNFIIQSFYPRLIHWFKTNRKDYITGLLVSEALSGFYGFIIKRSFKLPFLQPDFIAYDKRGITKDRAQKIRKKVPLLIWTIQSKEELYKFKPYADAFIMNIKN